MGGREPKGIINTCNLGLYIHVHVATCQYKCTGYMYQPRANNRLTLHIILISVNFFGRVALPSTSFLALLLTALVDKYHT